MKKKEEKSEGYSFGNMSRGGMVKAGFIGVAVFAAGCFVGRRSSHNNSSDSQSHIPTLPKFESSSWEYNPYNFPKYDVSYNSYSECLQLMWRNSWHTNSEEIKNSHSAAEMLRLVDVLYKKYKTHSIFSAIEALLLEENFKEKSKSLFPLFPRDTKPYLTIFSKIKKTEPWVVSSVLNFLKDKVSEDSSFKILLLSPFFENKRILLDLFKASGYSYEDFPLISNHLLLYFRRDSSLEKSRCFKKIETWDNPEPYLKNALLQMSVKNEERANLLFNRALILSFAMKEADFSNTSAFFIEHHLLPYLKSNDIEIKSINLSHCKLDSCHIGLILEILENCHTLNFVSLSSNNISYVGLKSIVKGMRDSSLKQLDMSSNRIDSDYDMIVEILNYACRTQLDEIDLSDNVDVEVVDQIFFQNGKLIISAYEPSGGLDPKDQEIERISSDVVRLNSENSKLERKKNKYKQAYLRKKDEHNLLEDNFNDLRERSEKLTLTLKEMDLKNKALLGEILKWEKIADIDNWKEELKQIEKEKEKLKDSNKSLYKTVRKLTRKIEDLKDGKEQYQLKYEKAKNEIDPLKSNKKEQGNEIIALEKKVTHYQKKSDSLDLELKQLLSKKKKFKDIESNLKKTVSTYSKKIEDLEEALKNCRENEWKIEGKILSLESGKKDLVEIVSELSNENKKLRREISLQSESPKLNVIKKTSQYSSRDHFFSSSRHMGYNPDSHNGLQSPDTFNEYSNDRFSKGYIRHSVEDDGNCGYTAFGITREQALTLLVNNLGDDVVLSRLRLVVKEQLLQENFWRYLSEQGAISRETAHETIINNIEDYSRDLSVLSAYLFYDIQNKRIDAGWSSPEVLQALAHIQGIELRIKKLEAEGILVDHVANYGELVNYSRDFLNPGADSRVDLLFINGNHFERLDYIGYEEQDGFPADDEVVYPSKFTTGPRN